MASTRQMGGLTAIMLLLAAVLLASICEGTPHNLHDIISKARAKRQFGLPGGFGPPAHLFTLGGAGGIGGGLPPLGVLADYRKCCCRFGVPPECLEKCVVRPGAPVSLPGHCAQYEQITAFECFNKNGAEDTGECEPDYSQPPPRAGTCPAMLLDGQDYMCSGDSCHTDHSCATRPNAKCCPTTCPDSATGRHTGKMICLEAVLGTTTRCEQHRHRVLQQLIDANERVNRSSLMMWVPQCTRREVLPSDPHGPTYRSTQCIAASDVCFCVNETTGQEMDGTRYRSDQAPVNCSRLNSEMYSSCRIEALLILEQHASMDMPEMMSAVEDLSVWIPECIHQTAVGGGVRSHRHLQCDTNSGLCWCTTGQGKAILDTVMPPGHPLFVEECTDFVPTPCEEDVASNIYDYRLAMYGLKNGSQLFQKREYYERIPNFFVHRCAQRGLSMLSSNAPSHSFEKIQYTLRQHQSLAERFCVDTKTGLEIPGSRTAAGEHRYVRSSPSTKHFCHMRSHCEETVLELLRRLNGVMLERGASGVYAMVNRQLAKSFGEYVPQCTVPGHVAKAMSRAGEPLPDAIAMYGYAPRQCGALNATCWCVYRDGQPVEGTLHRRNETTDCTMYQSLCMLPGHVRVQAPSHALRAAMRQCPAGQACRDIGLHIGIGLCQVEDDGALKACSLNRRTILHGARTLVQLTCQLCSCHDGALRACEQLPKSTCMTSQPCFVQTKVGHVTSLGDGMRVTIDCRNCVCNNGRVQCTQMNCSVPPVTLQVARPCSAAMSSAGIPARIQLCAPNGRTYPSASAARSCGGFTSDQLLLGPCSTKYVCRPGLCEPGYKCVPSPRQCLVAPCQQHLCVQENAECDMPSMPAASFQQAVENVETAPPMSEDAHACFHGNVSHTSLCHGLVRSGHVQYLGACNEECSGEVCGSDKVTYESRCHAHSSVTPVDYDGSCQRSCDLVKCPALEPECTVATRMPNDCCSFCGGGALVSISKPIARALVGSGYETANDIASILVSLQRALPPMTSAHCAVRGHVTLDDVMELRVETLPGSGEQGLYCFQAVQTLVTLVNTGATLQKNAVTAALTLANIQTARTGFQSSASTLTHIDLLMLAAIVLGFAMR
ncbi:uncharacterized protein LOC135822791 [Sycon ciliatum]|uniref:uncharacterized protein LOC135822791 n=1 Tax=Sycon ciliatum TaxID=27933 RepID=UPI0031F60F0C